MARRCRSGWACAGWSASSFRLEGEGEPRLHGEGCRCSENELGLKERLERPCAPAFPSPEHAAAPVPHPGRVEIGETPAGMEEPKRRGGMKLEGRADAERRPASARAEFRRPHEPPAH